MFNFPGEGPGDALRMRGAGEFVLSDDSDMECDTGPTDIFLGDFAGNVWDTLGVLARRVGVLWDWGIGVFLWPVQIEKIRRSVFCTFNLKAI